VNRQDGRRRVVPAPREGSKIEWQTLNRPHYLLYHMAQTLRLGGTGLAWSQEYRIYFITLNAAVVGHGLLYAYWLRALLLPL
jgi:hypothetical protein